MTEKCEFHELINDTVKRHDHEIRDIKDDLNELKISQTEVNVKFVSFMESMSKLPEILDSMKDATIGAGYEIQGMKKDIEEIKISQSKNDDKIEEIDNKDKVSILIFIKQNLWKIIGVLSLVAYATYMTIK